MASEFQRRLRRLARDAELKIADSQSNIASLRFNVRGVSQVLFVADYGNVWEFSCHVAPKMASPSDFPGGILAYLLTQNAKKKYGFWCIESVGDSHYLCFMHNIDPSDLNGKRFNKICWHIVKEVTKVEAKFAVIGEVISSL